MRFKTSAVAILATGAAVLTLASGPAAAQQGTLPGGADTLDETLGAWKVTCRSGAQDEQPAKTCSLSQRIDDAQKRRAMEISLVPQADGGAKGVIVLPFGLAVTKAVSLTLDGQPLGAPLAFSTCVPLGCLVPLDLDAASVAAAGKGKALAIAAEAASGRQITMTAPLDGFGPAFQRVADLLK